MNKIIYFIIVTVITALCFINIIMFILNMEFVSTKKDFLKSLIPGYLLTKFIKEFWGDLK